MRSRFGGALLTALAWFRLNQRPNDSENYRQSGNNEHRSTRHGHEPAPDMLRAEWATLQSLIREIHSSEEQHQRAERDLGAAQLRTAKGLNRVKAIGAIFSFVGLLGVAGSLIIARQAAEDGRVAADAARDQAKILTDQERKQLRGYFGYESFSLTCGDCEPTENDQFSLSMADFGQTPLTVIGELVGIVEYTIDEFFPEGDQTRSVPTKGSIQSISKSIAVYPRSPKTAYFPITKDIAMQFKDARDGRYWIMLRIEILYADIFHDSWYNYSCFMFDVRRKGGDPQKFYGCPEYNEERNASDEQPPPMVPTQIVFPDMLLPAVRNYELK